MYARGRAGLTRTSSKTIEDTFRDFAPIQDLARLTGASGKADFGGKSLFEMVGVAGFEPTTP